MHEAFWYNPLQGKEGDSYSGHSPCRDTRGLPEQGDGIYQILSSIMLAPVVLFTRR
jgi:hypothetical protein